MGAGARQRGDATIRQGFVDDASATVSVRNSYLNSLFSDLARAEKRADRAEGLAAELSKANALIARLRAENEVLRAEKHRMFGVVDATKRHISICGNPQKKWAVAFVKTQLQKAKLI